MTLDDESLEPECARTAVVLRSFLAGWADRTREPAVREHLKTCAACRARYESAVEDAAAVGSARRRKVEEEELRAARKAARREGRRPADPAADARRARGHRLRLLLLPAALILLMMQLGKLGKDVQVETRPIVSSVSGVVHAAGRTLAGESAPVSLTRGQRCETGPDGTARLRTGQVSFSLAPSTRMMVESPSRFRLERGRVELEGTCSLTTTLGVLEVQDGTGSFTLSGGSVEARVDGGTFVWTDPRGTRELAPGPNRTVAIGGMFAGS